MHGKQHDSHQTEKSLLSHSIQHLLFEKETLQDMKDMALTKLAATQHKLDASNTAFGTLPAQLKEAQSNLKTQQKETAKEIEELKAELAQSKADHANSIRTLTSQLRTVQNVAEEKGLNVSDEAPPYTPAACCCEQR